MFFRRRNVELEAQASRVLMKFENLLDVAQVMLVHSRAQPGAENNGLGQLLGGIGNALSRAAEPRPEGARSDD